jgi:hypothetical protein
MPIYGQLPKRRRWYSGTIYQGAARMHRHESLGVLIACVLTYVKCVRTPTDGPASLPPPNQVPSNVKMDTYLPILGRRQHGQLKVSPA